MADDIDDLLNEVESKFCASDKNRCAERQKKSVDASRSESSKCKSSAQTGPTATAGNKKSGDVDLNSMIDDIFEDSVPLDPSPSDRKHTKTSNPASTSSPGPPKTSGTARCFPVFMGGGSLPKGLCTAANKRLCDTLRCTDCDFRVEMFDDSCWHPKTDYLFLRNNMPDYDKLRPNLVPRKGWRAYGCQCKSKSVDDVTDVQATGLKWVCGKH